MFSGPSNGAPFGWTGNGDDEDVEMFDESSLSPRIPYSESPMDQGISLGGFSLGCEGSTARPSNFRRPSERRRWPQQAATNDEDDVDMFDSDVLGQSSQQRRTQRLPANPTRPTRILRPRPEDSRPPRTDFERTDPFPGLPQTEFRLKPKQHEQREEKLTRRINRTQTNWDGVAVKPVPVTRLIRLKRKRDERPPEELYLEEGEHPRRKKRCLTEEFKQLKIVDYQIEEQKKQLYRFVLVGQSELPGDLSTFLQRNPPLKATANPNVTAPKSTSLVAEAEDAPAFRIGGVSNPRRPVRRRTKHSSTVRRHLDEHRSRLLKKRFARVMERRLDFDPESDPRKVVDFETWSVRDLEVEESLGTTEVSFYLFERVVELSPADYEQVNDLTFADDNDADWGVESIDPSGSSIADKGYESDDMDAEDHYGTDYPDEEQEQFEGLCRDDDDSEDDEITEENPGDINDTMADILGARKMRSGKRKKKERAQSQMSVDDGDVRMVEHYDATEDEERAEHEELMGFLETLERDSQLRARRDVAMNRPFWG